MTTTERPTNGMAGRTAEPKRRPTAPDLILTGGPVWTGDAARRWARAVAVREGRIVGVGTERDIDPRANRRTRVIDLRGRLLLPGFQDAHVHPPMAGRVMLQCDLHDERGRDAYLEAIRAYAASHPGEAWILGGGWAMPDFPGGAPRRDDLDAIVPDRPVFLPNRDGHSAWVNSAALRLAGISRDTPEPAHGRIERGPGGEPSGTLHEGAMDLVERLAPPESPADLERALLTAQAHLHSLGITAWQDAIVTPPYLAAYKSVAGRGQLTARVVGALWWDREGGEDQLDGLVEEARTGSAGTFRPTSVKLMQDGVLEDFTAGMLEPYLDGRGGASSNRGMSFIEPERLKRVVTRLDAAGVQPHFHAIGDRAVRECLDAVEAARAANGASDTRPHIAHIQVIHPADVPRFRSLGVVANAQPLWAQADDQMTDLTIPFIGQERAGWQYPFESLRRSGAVLAMGSDWSVSSPDPLLEMEVAVERRPPDRRDAPPFLPDERLALGDAIAAFTMGSAFANHLDDRTGSIEVGKEADLVVLDRDPFDPAAGSLGEARVLLTLIGGRPVHEDPALGG